MNSTNVMRLMTGRCFGCADQDFALPIYNALLFRVCGAAGHGVALGAVGYAAVYLQDPEAVRPVLG